VAATGVEKESVKTFDDELGAKRVLATAPDTPSAKDWKPVKARGQVVINQTNYMGTMLFVSYMVAAAYYFYVRATKTLDIGYVWWAAPARLAPRCALASVGACQCTCLPLCDPAPDPPPAFARAPAGTRC
jgi:hypothetical protein